MKHLAIAAAAALIAVSVWALAPRLADAQSGSGMIVAQFGSVVYCPAAGQTAVSGGHYFSGSSTVVILPTENRGWSCRRGTVLTGGRPARQRGDWTIRLQSEPGNDGALLTGGSLSLAPTFTGKRGGSGLTSLNNRQDGAWPTSQGRYTFGVVAFTVPASHTGNVYLHVIVDYYDSAGGALTEAISFGFEPPVAPIHATEADPDPDCPHVLERSTRLLLHSLSDGDPNNLYREQRLLECDGSTRWAVRQYLAIAPLHNFRLDYAGACTDVKTITIATFEQRVDDDGTEYHWRYRGQRYCSTYYYPEFYGLTYWARCEPHHRVTVDVLDRRLMPGTTTVAYHVRVSWTTLCHDPDHRSWESASYDNTTTETYWTTQPPAVVPAPASSS